MTGPDIVSVYARVRIPPDKLEEFCRRNHIRKLSFFGSVLRDDFGPASDIDVMVEFEPEHVPGLRFFTSQEEMAAILGRGVDLTTRRAVESSANYLRRKRILDTTLDLYVEG